MRPTSPARQPVRPAVRWLSVWAWSAAALLLVGCKRTDRNYLELLNAEKRGLEDELYDLAYDYEILMDKVDRLKAENQSLRHNGDLEPLPRGESSDDSEPSGRRSPDAGPLEIAPGGPPEIDPPVLDPPALDPPTLDPPTLDPAAGGARRADPAGADPAPAPPASPAPRAPPAGDPPARGGVGELPAPAATTAGIGRVASIRLNPVHTGGDDFDSRPGDDGVTVLIEPRGVRGEIVPRAAALAVVVLDPAQSGEGMRLARWDFTAEEAAEHVVHAGAHRGIRLRLPWSGARPQHARLHLFVRYLTDDGRKLEADREFFVTLRGEVANRWTPRSTERRLARRRAEPRSAGGATSPPPARAPSARAPAARAPAARAPAARAPAAREPAARDHDAAPATPSAATPSGASAPSEPLGPAPPPRKATRPQWRPYR